MTLNTVNFNRKTIDIWNMCGEPMSDREIADKLNMVRYTIQRKRVKSLKEMKQRLEVNEDGGQSEE